MPALVRDLRHPSTIPSSIYLDTSVLLAAFRGDPSSTDPMDIATRTFVNTLGAARPGSAWTSILAIEEACWVPLRRSLTDAAATHRRKLGRKRRLELGQFRTEWPAEYATAYASARPGLERLMAFLKALPIDVRGPHHPRETSNRASRAICYTVAALSRRYQLEMADLFHIAIAKLDGTDAIASLDKGFRDVDGIELYTVP